MTEPVRLVIWDLDETFWTGTVTEGGHQYQKSAHDMVIELARRGIMSSICSKNDFAPIRAILEAEGIWEYFIFPSIDWSPKGPRIAAIIEAVQLRPAAVMFIDDNPMNLAEAKHVTPDLQIADEKIIPALLDNPLFKGKGDSGLSRLAQYKLLEKRNRDQASSGSDNTDFLRASNIRVVIEHDVERHIDRCIELINRTNQLNFTKLRLPENLEKARAKFRQEFVATWRMQTGLVRVVDNYGDYGFCGFYAYDALLKGVTHYCFSCRILGMGVEQWLYARLGKPPIVIKGDVLSELNAPADVDWIRYSQEEGEAESDASLIRLGSVFLHGGCELTAASHYLSLVSKTVVGEYNVLVAGHQLRFDHSNFLRYAVEGLSPAAVKALALVGYDFNKHCSKLEQLADESDVFMFSFSTDAQFALYRHRDSGAEVPLQLGQRLDFRRTDLTSFSDEVVAYMIPNPEHRRIMKILREQFEFVGPIDRARFMHNVEKILTVAGETKPVIFLSGWEGHKPGDVERHTKLNQWLTAASDRHSNVIILDISECIHDKSEVKDPTHFNRKVYHRISEKVVKIVTAFTARAGVAEHAGRRQTVDALN